MDSAGGQDGPSPIRDRYLAEQLELDPRGIVGALARSFDLISAEYGWSDNALLDLSLSRIRQITIAIMQRHAAEHFRQRRLLNWQTQTLATYVAGAAMTDGESNPLLEEACKIDIDGLVEQAKELPKENAPGSYEALMRGF